MRALAVLLAAMLSASWAGCFGDFDEPRFVQGNVFAFATVERGDPAPKAMRSCSALLEELNERALDHARVSLEQSIQNSYYYGARSMGGDVAMAGSVEDSDSRSVSAPKSGSARGASVTGTNNQEAAADEADIVKTDGEWTYVLSNGALYILHSEDVGDIALHWKMEFPDTWGGDMLLEARDPDNVDDDRLVLILPRQAPQGADVRGISDADSSGYYGQGMTQVIVLSLRDRDAPRIEKEWWIEGYSVGGRLVDGTAYVSVHSYEQELGLQMYAYPDEETRRKYGLTYERMARLSDSERMSFAKDFVREADKENQEKLENATLEDHLPTMLKPRLGAPGHYDREPINERSCSRVLTSEESTGRGFTTILAVAVDASTLVSSSTQVASAHPILYATDNALVLAAPSQDLWWFWAQPDLDEATDLHWFELDDLNVRLKASGRVAGIVQDSFGIDVEGEDLRVATTTGSWGRWWNRDQVPMMNHLAVFEAKAGKLVANGMVGGIAPGERIWSARFTEDRAYIVTFRQTDPLYVIDLNGKPEILGELKIPGVSTYIHPLDDGALLTIGYAPGPGGENLDWSKTQVSLFDISDVRNPKRADVLTFGAANGWSSSSAVQEHKAFTYWADIETLAIPLTTQRHTETYRNGEYISHDSFNIGLKLIQVERESLDLSLRGEVNQNKLLPQDNHYYGVEIQRSYFLGYPDEGPVSVYAISPLGVTSHDLGTLLSQDSVKFSNPQPGYSYG